MNFPFSVIISVLLFKFHDVLDGKPVNFTIRNKSIVDSEKYEKSKSSVNFDEEEDFIPKKNVLEISKRLHEYPKSKSAYKKSSLFLGKGSCSHHLILNVLV